VIVTCEQCSTQFQLDDAKVPETGARVRCSRCKHAFFIEAPGRADVARADELAREALGRGAEAGEEVDPESDWQFNHDSDAEAGVYDRASAARAVDQLLGADPEPDAGAGADLSISSAGDSLEQEVGDPPPAGGPDPLPEEPAGEAASASAPELAAAEPDLGDPEDWDFFDQAEARGGPDGDPAPRAVLGRVELVREAWKEPLREVGPGSGRGVRSRRPAPLALDLEEAAARRRAWLARAGNASGWLVTAALAAFGLYRGLAPRAAEAVRPPVPVLAGLEARSVEGRWVENARAGALYVVSGRLVNSGEQAAEPRAVLRAVLLDAAGDAVPAEPAVLGPERESAEVRERDPRDLREEQELAARQLAWASIGAGRDRPFQALFADVPPAAERFRIELGPGVPEPAPAPEPAPTPAAPLP
jgi:predicted Zn finger-like uncharacterized protein